jgi:DDE_Tnp_1-associated
MDVPEFFFEIDDPRQDGKCFHQLSDILMIVLCGYLADCEEFEEIYDDACDRQHLLAQFLELPCGIPSHDTLNRVFRRLEPTQLERVLTNWGKDIVGLLNSSSMASNCGEQWKRGANRPVSRSLASGPSKSASVWHKAK